MKAQSQDPKFDPRTGRRLPDNIRWLAKRQRYQFRIKIKSFDGTWVERSGTFETLVEAKRELKKLEQSKNIRGNVPLNIWFEEYWPVIEASVRPRTAISYEISWRKRVQPSLGHMRLEEINPTVIERAMTGWQVKASTKHDALAVLSRLLDGAMRSDIIGSNPVLSVKKPRIETNVSLRSRALSKEEIKEFLSLIPEGIYRSFATALVYTGMRVGEASALRVSDVNGLCQVL